MPRDSPPGGCLRAGTKSIFSDVLQGTKSPLNRRPAWATSNITFQVEHKPRLDVLEQRAVLSSIRAVSRAWNDAADSHPFWTRYIHTYGGAVSVPMPIEPSSRSSSQAKTKTTSPFRAAQLADSCWCTICAVNDYQPHSADYAVSTRYSRRTPICRGHRGQFCVTCLISGTLSLGSELKYPYLAEVQGDYDERGFPTSGICCRGCRVRRWGHGISSEFRGQAGPMEMIQPSSEVQAYFNLGTGSGYQLAQHAVALSWIQRHVDFVEIRRAEEALFRLEMYLRERFFDREQREDKWEAFRRKDLEGPLWDLEADDVMRAQEFQEELEESEMAQLYVLWEEEMDEREARRGDCEDEDEAYDDFDDEFAMERENSRRQVRLIKACVRHYINDRIRNGWWAHPREEMHAALTACYNSANVTELFTPASQAQALNPLDPSTPACSIPPVCDIARGAHGLLFLPSIWLVNLLTEDYERRIVDVLSPALREVANLLESQGGDSGLRGMTAAKLLGCLRLRECWLSGGLIEACNPASAPLPAAADVEMSPEPEPSLQDVLFKQSPSLSSIKRAQDDEGKREAEVKRRKASHDSSTSSAETLAQSQSLSRGSVSDPSNSTAPSSVTTPDAVIPSAVCNAPLVPAAGVQIGRFAKDTIFSIWRAQCERLNRCHCPICRRRDAAINLVDIELEMDTALRNINYI